MSSYIFSNANRTYVALEDSYGQPAAIGAANRFPAFRLHAHQRWDQVRRKDKTGSRTLLNSPSPLRITTEFAVEAYLVSSTPSGEQAYGPLFQAACGSAPSVSQGLIVQTTQQLQLQTSTAHDLSVGSAISYRGEIRFVTNIIDSLTFLVNAPFDNYPVSGAVLEPATTYRLATELPSLSVYDYWDPITTVSRIIAGAVVNAMTINVDGPYHDFTFTGPAADLLDSANVGSGGDGITSFAVEPSISALNYAVVPSNLGKVWIGEPANAFLTISQALVQLKNNVALRDREYGYATPRAVTCGRREISSRLSLLTRDDAQTVALYAAAKQRSSLPIMLQMGGQQGQVMAVYMPNMIPEIPVYDDAQPRLVWEFQNNIARGIANDELMIAFA